MTASLLPPNATPYELAMEGATARVGAVPVPVDTLALPESCPTEALPWLAWAEDVPVWDPAWPEAVKRGAIEASRRLHRRQGTIGGLKALARWAGGTLLKAVTPPAKKFLAPSLGTDARNALVALLPQLRITPHREPGRREGRTVFFREDYLGACFPHRSTAAARSVPTAAIEGRAAVEPCAVTMAGRVATVARYGTAGRASVLGGFPKMLVPTTAAGRLYHLDLSTPYADAVGALRRTAARPTSTALPVRPDRLPVPGTARGLFAGRPLHGCTHRSDAVDRLIDRVYVVDPALSAGATSAACYIGGSLGMTPHTGIMQVQIRGRRPAQSVRGFVRGYLCRSSQAKLGAVRAAMAWGKRGSDKLSMDTVTLRPIRAGAVLLAGQALAGALAPT